MISGYLPVSYGHTIYYELHGVIRGTKHTKCAVVLHGGPGAGLDRTLLQLFDLKHWCVLLFDQRGCVKSTPFGSLDHNTTWDLIEDIESLRCLVGCDTWLIQGGSWGTTLALAYAEKYPERVSGLVLRGLSLSDETSFSWFYEKGGASEVYPEQWTSFVSVLPPRLRTAGWRQITAYYQKKLKSPIQAVIQRYADTWCQWETSTMYFIPKRIHCSPKENVAVARLENHYFVHDCWLKPNQLIKDAYKLRHIPITIVHGRYDMICPITASFELCKALPHVKLIVLNVGHDTEEPGMMKALKQSVTTMTSRYRKRQTRKKRRE